MNKYMPTPPPAGQITKECFKDAGHRDKTLVSIRACTSKMNAHPRRAGGINTDC